MRKAVLFDIDGTLLDTYNFVFNAVKHSVKVHGYSYPAKEKIGLAMGKPILEFYEVLVPEADPSLLANTHIEFQRQNFHLAKPFQKTKKILKHLKNSGFLIGAVSNRLKESLLHTLKRAKLYDYFDVIISADDVVNAKPHPRHLLTALNKLEVKPENSYMVGDTDQDILAGKNAGVKTVGVTYGFLGPEIRKYNPDYLIDGIEELLEIIGN